MRVAALDCGTNSVRLLVTDGTTELVRETRIVRLGQGVDRTRTFAPQAIERTRVALVEYAELIAGCDVQRTRFVATSASRDVSNRAEFVAMVRDTVGVEPEVITGDEEAALSFAGAVGSIDGLTGTVLLVDLGGGSTELVVGSFEHGSPESLRAHSMDVGSVRMTERHLHDDPPTPAQVGAVVADVQAAIAAARRDVPTDEAGALVGVAGTITTVAAIALGLEAYDSAALHGARISAQQIDEVTERLTGLDHEGRSAIGVIHPGRVDVITAGAIVLRTLMHDVGAAELIASEHDILDGIALFRRRAMTTADGARRGTSPAIDAAVILETMAVGLITIDPSWVMTHVNAAAERILGYRADEILGWNVWERFPGAREIEFGHVYERVMQHRQPESFDAFYPGLGMWFELRVQPTDEGIACFFLDVTARKLADRRAAEDVRRARLVADVAEALSSSLDLESNAARLAQLVVPYLGSWSIVSLADDDGALTDVSSWHVEAGRRADVAQYSAVRHEAMPGTLADDAVRSGRAVALMSNAHAQIRARLVPGATRDLFDRLAPVASAVLPMVARGRTVGALTVYSDIPWTDEQFAVARDIASRAALAIDNSLAYERVRVAREEAEHATERIALLARISETLAGIVDADAAVSQLARLVVPHLGDWSLVTVVDEQGAMRDIGFAHSDTAREREVAAYAARRAVAMSDDAPLAQALRSGQPVVIDALSDERLQSAQPDAAVAQIARGLDPHGLAIIPLTARGRVFGALTLVTTHERGAHTDEELAIALQVAQRAGPVLDGAQVAHRARRLGESIQRSMLAVPASGAGMRIRTRYRPAQHDNEVGGDWYDHFDLADGSTVLTIGDVMGHDTAAIAAMAQLRTFMRATAWAGRHSPSEVLADTDSASRQLGPGTFATAVTGELERADADGRVVFRWSNAGHPPPVVLAPDRTVRWLRPPVSDIPLGVLPRAVRHDHTTVLEPGSVLLMYTDGLVERRDADIEHGLDRLEAALTAAHHRDLDELVDTLLADLGGTSDHNDDIAMIAVQIIGSSMQRRGANLLPLPEDKSASWIARRYLEDYLAEFPAEFGTDGALCVSELVSNALRHGAPPFALSVERAGAGLRIAVRDHGVAMPQRPLQPVPSHRQSGRGLLILDALAADWGVEPADVGKTVWFTLLPR